MTGHMIIVGMAQGPDNVYQTLGHTCEKPGIPADMKVATSSPLAKLSWCDAHPPMAEGSGFRIRDSNSSVVNQGS